MAFAINPDDRVAVTDENGKYLGLGRVATMLLRGFYVKLDNGTSIEVAITQVTKVIDDRN